jgi:glycerol-3-phosphate dehydrogenase subunit C
MREGNLEAPTRHAIDWKNPGFYDQAACEKEMERIFDICHGCRRCVSLCNAFPKLFDFIDEAGDAETAGVPKQKYWQVVDQCYLCDVCYMTKCPYVPPHQWNLDFPHTMLRAKAIQYKTGKMKFRDKLLTSTELVGTLSSIPVVAQAVNAANKFGPARTVLQQALGVDARRQLPEFDSANFRAEAVASHNHPVREGGKSPRQGRRLLHLLRQLQRAGHRPRPAQAARPQRDSLPHRVRAKPAAACPSWNWATCKPWRSTRSATSR